MTVACVLIPRFQLRVAAGQSWRADSPSALGSGGAGQLVAEVSPAAEALGVRPTRGRFRPHR